MASLQDDHDEVVERFEPTSGRVSGWMTVVLTAVLAVAGVAYADEGFPLWVAAAGVLVGVLAWAVMLRPALWVTTEHLVMQNLGETLHIRLAAIEEMAVRQVLVVRAADRRFVSTVVGRTWRKALTSRHRPGGLAGDAALAPTEGMHYADFVENRLYDLVDTARRRAEIRPGSPEQLALPGAVRREPAWVPLGLISAALLLLVLSLVL
ncbi:hypothetical protein L2K70_14200 [Nocardioides KLBMP 9356]|uniref:PH domain-containing protein n=1 Tax=Nocardioides potassii TaxID=2911371 RepID=A0ABS9HEK2_9ACTN|nr:hypothetical protein [Nocardioides potassii]MCF6378762.1 hypothetical protein [Nocardioides potassii]